MANVIILIHFSYPPLQTQQVSACAEIWKLFAGSNRVHCETEIKWMSHS